MPLYTFDIMINKTHTHDTNTFWRVISRHTYSLTFPPQTISITFLDIEIFHYFRKGQEHQIIYIIDVYHEWLVQCDRVNVDEEKKIITYPFTNIMCPVSTVLIYAIIAFSYFLLIFFFLSFHFILLLISLGTRGDM